MNLSTKTDLSSIGLFTILALVWGSSFILIKKALISFDPYEVAALRILLSTITFMPFLIHFWKEINWKKWKAFTIVGLTGSGIPAFMYPIGQLEISSSIAGILNSTTPIFTFVLGILFFKSSFVASKFMGILIGLIGTALLILYGQDYSIGGNPWYSLFIIVGTICYGTNINVVKSVFQNTSPLKLSAVSFCIIGPPALIFLLMKGTFSSLLINSSTLPSIGAIAVLSIFGTVISTVLFFRLVQKTSAIFASSVAYIIPIVAIIWGFLDGESIGWIHFVGMLLIIFGVRLIKR